MRRMKLYMVIEVPDSVHVKDLEEHAATAVKQWGGSLPPGDEFFPANISVLSCRATVDVTKCFNEHPSKRAQQT